MVVSIPLPQLGESVNSGTIVAWLVAVGDAVAVGQPCVEISTDKVDSVIPSPAAGTVTSILARVDEEVSVGAPIMELDSGSDVPDQGSSTVAATNVEPEARSTSKHPLSVAVVASSAMTTPGGPVSQASATSGEIRLSPLIKRMMRDNGINPAQVVGTGPGGRITTDDVQAAIDVSVANPITRSNAPDPTATAATTGTPTAIALQSTPASTIEPISRTRKVIAERMRKSLQSTAQLTSAVEADLSRIMAIRRQVRDLVKRKYGISLSPLAFIAHATVRTLADHPVLNASIDLDAGEITHHGGVGLGIAVDAPQGLIVPVLRDAQRLDPIGLQQRITDVAARARVKQLTPDDLQSGTFTITNTGTLGSLFDTPILNPPEVGNLVFPAIEKRPVIITDEAGCDQVAIRHRTYLCLTYDHRLVDGADAARFLGDLTTRVDSSDWGSELSNLIAMSEGRPAHAELDDDHSATK